MFRKNGKVYGWVWSKREERYIPMRIVSGLSFDTITRKIMV